MFMLIMLVYAYAYNVYMHNHNAVYAIMVSVSSRSCYFIKSQISGYVITVLGSKENPSGLVTGKQVHKNNDNQLWYDDPAGGTIRSKFNDFCIDVEGLWINGINSLITLFIY